MAKPMDYVLESTTVTNGYRAKTIIHEVNHMERHGGVMNFMTVRNGTIRRKDSDWNLVSLRRRARRSRWS